MHSYINLLDSTESLTPLNIVLIIKHLILKCLHANKISSSNLTIAMDYMYKRA